MNIQKSRFAAVLTMALVACMMLTVFVVPASATTVNRTFVEVEIAPDLVLLERYHNTICSCGFFDVSKYDKTTLKGFVDSEDNFYFEVYELWDVLALCDCRFFVPESFIYDWIISDPELYLYDTHLKINSDTIITIGEVFDGVPEGYIDNPGISDVVTPELFNTVLDEIAALLPITIPVMIGFIGLRKGISFLQSVLHSA